MEKRVKVSFDENGNPFYSYDMSFRPYINQEENTRNIGLYQDAPQPLGGYGLRPMAHQYDFAWNSSGRLYQVQPDSTNNFMNFYLGMGFRPFGRTDQYGNTVLYEPSRMPHPRNTLPRFINP